MPSFRADRLHPFFRFLREGAGDGSLPAVDDTIATADVAFNAVAWPYVHLRGRHEWPAENARASVVGVELVSAAEEVAAAM